MALRTEDSENEDPQDTAGKDQQQDNKKHKKKDKKSSERKKQRKGPVVLAPPYLNISLSGNVPTEPTTFTLHLPCTGAASAQVDVTLNINVTSPRPNLPPIQLYFKRRKICLEGTNKLSNTMNKFTRDIPLLSHSIQFTLETIFIEFRKLSLPYCWYFHPFPMLRYISWLPCSGTLTWNVVERFSFFPNFLQQYCILFLGSRKSQKQITFQYV